MPLSNTASNVSPSPPSILFVDDERSILDSHKRLMRKTSYNVFCANSGKEGLDILEKENIDVIVSDMRMPEMTGAQLLSNAKKLYPDTVRILLTGFSDMESTIQAINEGAIYRYISKPWSNDELKKIIHDALEIKRLRLENDSLLKITQEQNHALSDLNQSLEEKVEERTEKLKKAADYLKKLNSKLEKTNCQIVEAFSVLIENATGKSTSTNRKKAKLAKSISQALENPSELSDQVYYASLLHQIGLLGLPREVVNTPKHRLSGMNLFLYHKHPGYAESALNAIENLDKAAEMLKHQQEYWDGTGYPDGKLKESIPVGSRILSAINDYFDLLNGDLLGENHSTEEAIEYLEKKAGMLYDAKVIQQLKKLVTSEQQDPHLSNSLKVPLLNLKEGMVLADDLITSSGIFLLREGATLTETTISRIKDYFNEEQNTSIAIQKDSI